MVKKIILWSGLALMIGILIFGAVNRTLARSGNAETGQGYSHSQNQAAQSEQDYQNNTAWEAGQGRGRQNELNAQQNSGRQNNSSAQRAAEPGEGEAQITEQVMLNGKVTQVDGSTVAIAVEDGAAIELSGRAWSYAQQQGFAVRAGDPVSMIGFYEDGKGYEIIRITNLANGQELALREDTGRPMWAGRQG